MPDEAVDEHKLLRDTERATHAEHLLKDELLQEAFKTLEAKYVDAWRGTGISEQDTHARERLWQAINLLGKVQDHLKKIVTNGRLSKRQLDEIEQKRTAAALEEKRLRRR